MAESPCDVLTAESSCGAFRTASSPCGVPIAESPCGVPMAESPCGVLTAESSCGVRTAPGLPAVALMRTSRAAVAALKLCAPVTLPPSFDTASDAKMTPSALAPSRNAFPTASAPGHGSNVGATRFHTRRGSPVPVSIASPPRLFPVYSPDGGGVTFPDGLTHERQSRAAFTNDSYAHTGADKNAVTPLQTPPFPL